MNRNSKLPHYVHAQKSWSDWFKQEVADVRLHIQMLPFIEEQLRQQAQYVEGSSFEQSLQGWGLGDIPTKPN